MVAVSASSVSLLTSPAPCALGTADIVADGVRSRTQPITSAGSQLLVRPAARENARLSAVIRRSGFWSEISVKNTASSIPAMRSRRMAPQAAVATEAPSKASSSFSLQDGSKLEVATAGASDEERAYVELRVKGGSLVNAQLLAHWGATKAGERSWTLPGLLPDGTKNHKNRALQSRFRKEGDELVLKIQIEQKYDAVEFTLKDEATNNWYKNNDGNFRVEIPPSTAKLDPNKIVIPQDLLQVHAYLNWEKNGKQNYSPEEEKEEFEKGRRELQLQVASGETTIGELRQKFLGGAGGDEKPKETATNGHAAAQAPDIPEDLMAIQSYIRWERNGKKNYSPEEQQREYEEAKNELQRLVMDGMSIEDLRKKLTGGSGATAPPPPPPKKAQSQSRLSRKQNDPMSLINKVIKGGAVAPVAVAAPKEPTKLEAMVESIEEASIIFKKIHKFGGDQLLVLVTEDEQGAKLLLASSVKDTFTAHWGLAKAKGHQWENVQQTPFKTGYSGVSSLQYLEVPLGKEAEGYSFVPFVLNAGDNWYKDNGSDFWVPLKKAEKKPAKDVGDGSGTAKALLDEIADQESEAEKSLMHRFNIGANLLDTALPQGELGLAALLVWFRFSATRQLIWNKNYNVKPREISTAQDRMTGKLTSIFQNHPQYREMVRMILSTVGRGGEGDVGQRIRDEILVIQRANDCKGGMMEEWHQKLHNNTSPDDVVICQALLDHIRSNFDMDVYWKTLTSNGVNKERLRSYDRPIVSEPNFRADQKDGLIRDLTNYMKSLKAVHSGADLESAIATCMGYSQGATESFMASVNIHPIRGLSGNLPRLLQFVLEHVEDRQVVPLLEGLLEARYELRSSLQNPQERLKDVIFLDLALDGTVRTAVERGMEYLDSNRPEEVMYMVSLVVENLCLSTDKNEELVYCLKDWRSVIEACERGEHNWALRSKAVADRTRLTLSEKAEYMHHSLQPSADYLGAQLNIDDWAVSIFSEEMIRSTSAASLSLLLNRLDPVLRAAADMGSWQVISPVEVKGFVEVVEELGLVQDKVYHRPTVLVAGRVKGEEEIPEGAVAVLTPDMPDILSHVSVRARNSKVCFATCFDEKVLAELRSLDKKAVALSPTPNADLNFSVIGDNEVNDAAPGGLEGDDIPEHISITKKHFAGKFALVADEFTPDLVGAKSRNIADLRGRLPSWVNLPTSVALPFGSFEKVLADSINKDVAAEIDTLSKELASGDFSKLPIIRETVRKLRAPDTLVTELKTAMKSSGMPWPLDESQERWEQAWTAIKKVWASKWNERAYFSMRKVGLNFADLCMSVLVQEVIQADYAFVIHTTNPSTGDKEEIYAEVVKGLGETLVGAYDGRALSFSTKKADMGAPHVLGYPSKRVGLFIRQSIIFRSDSNGEDLEGYAGAGLYDSVPMDKEEEIIVDYSTDPLLLDQQFQKDVLQKIAQVGYDIEKALGSPQDIEGVVKNKEIYVVQTRPQM